MKLLQPADKVKRKMVLFATLFAKLGSTVLALFAGNTALASSVTMELSAISPLHTVVVPDILFGTKENATVIIQTLAVRNGEQSGTPNANKTSTMLLAVSVHQTAHLE